jgi:hypothetical protein
VTTSRDVKRQDESEKEVLFFDEARQEDDVFVRA